MPFISNQQGLFPPPAPIPIPATLTGTLYKVNPTDEYTHKTVNFDYRIISTKFSYITPPSFISDATYIVTDPKLSHPLGTFTLIDTGGLKIQYEIIILNNFIVDPTLVKLNTTDPDLYHP